MKQHNRIRRGLSAALGIAVLGITAIGTTTFVGAKPAQAEDPRATGGSWSPVIDLGTQAISSASLPDGRVMIWSSVIRDGYENVNGKTYGLVYDPTNGTIVEADNNLHNMYCGGVATLDDGRIIATAGRETSNDTSLFTPSTGTWAVGQKETAVGGRYYPTTVALPTGQALTALGTGGNGTASVWSSDTGWSTLSGLSLSDITGEGPYGDYYPYLHVAPNGLLFHAGPTPKMHYLDWRGNGARYNEGVRNTNDKYRLYGSDALFDTGKILMAGGAPGWTNGSVPASSTTLEIDLNAADGVPVVTEVGSMAHGRYGFNMVDLPNGEVLAVGGNNTDLIFSDANAVLTPEVYNPTTKTWRTVADLTIPRNFHSSAVLLKDGRVWVAGGTGHQDAQIWTPPYLYNSDGTSATRPIVDTAPETIDNGDVVTVTGSDDITKFSMLKVSATTHGLNTDQRNVPVSFEKTGTGNYSITANSNPYELVPGDYWLFGTNSAGVPTMGRSIHVNRPSSLPAPVIPDTVEGGGSDTGELVGPMPGGATNMSVSSTGTVIAVAPDDRVWKWNGGGWTEILGKLLKRASVRTPAVGQDEIWGLASDGTTWRRAGTSWSEIAGKGIDVAIANGDGTVWRTDGTGTYKWTGGTSTTDSAANWALVPGSATKGVARLVQVSGKSESDLWGVSDSNTVWHCDGVRWKRSLKWVSEAADGTVVGASPDNKVMKYTGKRWIERPGPLAQLSLGSATNMWGVDSSNRIFKTAD